MTRRGNYLAQLLALAMVGGGRFADALPRTGPAEPREVNELERQHAIDKRRARNLRRLAKAACTPRWTTTHRAPCGDCYYCQRVA